MLILEIKDGDTIDKVLKKYKRKYEKSGILKELRRRKAFSKPSVQRRTEVLKAVYKEDMYGNKNDWKMCWCGKWDQCGQFERNKHIDHIYSLTTFSSCFTKNRFTDTCRSNGGFRRTPSRLIEATFLIL